MVLNLETETAGGETTDFGKLPSSMHGRIDKINLKY
jgi:hypothetical protein